MSFWGTAQYPELREGRYLRALCKTQLGEWAPAVLDLNDYIGNDDGRFTEESKGYWETARDARLEGPVLVAELQNKESRMVEDRVDLNEFVAKGNGSLDVVGGAS